MTGRATEGLLLVAKRVGPTSHDVVQLVRRASGCRRVGHAGTLDPAASGLLPLVLGRATRLVRFLPDAPKTYRGRLRLGVTTTTDDATGEVLSEHRGPLPAPERVLATARSLEGRVEQVPPLYSARHVAGQRLYALARKGVGVKPAPAVVEVERFELAPAGPDLFEFTAVVSAGTYIRALARDLGRALECGGTLVSLVRTGIGPLRLDDARELPEGGPDLQWVLDGMIRLEHMPLVPPPLRLDRTDEAGRFCSGAKIRLEAAPSENGPVRVLDGESRLLGIGEANGGLLHPRVVIRPEHE